MTFSNDMLRNEARDPDVASIEEAFVYVAPIHASVVRDAQAALRRLVEEVDKWHRESLDWQQAKSDVDAEQESAEAEVRRLTAELKLTREGLREIDHAVERYRVSRHPEKDPEDLLLDVGVKARALLSANPPVVSGAAE